MAAQQSWKTTGVLSGVTDCRRSRKWAAEEDGCWDLKLGATSMNREDHEVLGEKGEDHAALAK